METEFCDKCHGNGIIICRCAGDSCGCGTDHYDCPYCDTAPEPPEGDEWTDPCETAARDETLSALAGAITELKKGLEQ